MEENTQQTLPAVVEQAKADIQGYKARLAEAKEKFMSLKVETTADKAIYEEISTGLRKATKTRTTIESKRKEYTAPFVRAQKEINQLAREVTEQVESIEYHLKMQKGIFERMVEEEKKAEYLAKLKMLTDAGALYDGSMYIAGPFAIHPNELQELSKEDVQAKAAEMAEWKRLDDKRKADEAAELARLEQLRKEAAAAEPAPRQQAPTPSTLPEGDFHTPPSNPNPWDRRTYQTQPVKLPEIPAGNVTVTTADYSNGFKDAQRQVIALFEDGVKRTRAEFIELIQNLKPAK